MYTLSIQVQCENKDLLENLMITFESIKGDVSQLQAIELLTVSGPAYVYFADKAQASSLTVQQRNLFLDQWSITEGEVT